ncbi:MAG: hypothetical protein RLZZ475_2055 [Pseudomonadota bacterium]|jgi:hypothetical protein
MSAYPTANEAVPLEPIANSEFFLGDVRRGPGVLCTLDEGGIWRQYPFADPEDALARLEVLKDTRDVFVTMGTLREGARQRTADNVVSLCGFFADLDCHGADGDYANVNEASLALRSFCQVTALPKPDYLVSSGHGLHAHWTFYDPIPRDVWQEVANDLKALMMAHGLKADHQVTADPARVLRVPCTYNYRNRAEPVEVELLPIPSLAEPTTLTEFRSALSKALGKPALPYSGHSGRSLSPLMRLVVSRQEVPADTPENVELVRRMLDYLNPDTDYHEWRSIVWGVAATGLGSAHDVAQEWSARGEKWDPKVFDRVWSSFDASRDNAIGFSTLVKLARAAGYEGGIPTAATTALAYSGAPPRFRLLDRAAIMAQPPLRWRLKGIFPETGIGAIYGPSASGKSFLGLDLGISIALGDAWFGHRSYAAPVTYIMLEGEGALRNRIEAWEKHNQKQVPSGFRAMAQPFALADSTQVDELGALVPSGGVVIIDTLNRAAPGLDENSSQDMGLILAGMKRLQEITRGLVLIVHHTGKDASKGLRGHSSLFAALDGVIEVERNGPSRSWSAAKVKDGEDGKQMPFKLNVIDLGTDYDGDPIVSCAAGPDTGAIFKVKEPTGANQRAALKAIQRALSVSTTIGQAGAPQGSRCLTIEAAIAEAAHALPAVEKKRRTQRAREAVQGLVSSGHLRRGLDDVGDEWVWL